MNLVTPTGFRDILSDEATERERKCRIVQDLFAAAGFSPIETPTLEAMDVVSVGGHLPDSPFKFFDSQGDLLAMRPDVTTQIARMCATRIPESAFPLRLRYTQRVFRELESDNQAKPREMTQMGIECIGEGGADTDLEVVSLFVRALRASGVAEICLALASVAPLRALLDRSGADGRWKRAVLNAYHESDFVELDRLCTLDGCTDFDTSGVAPAYADAIRRLARIRGGIEAIESARALTLPLGCACGLDELESIVTQIIDNADLGGDVQEDGVEILVDFSVISSFDYYTGIVFEAYSPYLGTSLGSGGRYDNMIAAFGRELPAAGFAFSLEQTMAAEAAEGEAALDDVERPAIEDDAVAGALGKRRNPKAALSGRRLRIAVPKGALNAQAIECLSEAGLDTEGLADPGRQLVISTRDADYFIVRPSDAAAFVAFGAADCGICGRDSLLESRSQVVELVDLKFGECRFVVAQPSGSQAKIDERYRRLGSIRVATKYPNITLAHYAKTGVQVDIVKLHGNIELAPLTGMADRIVDITATGTTLRENDLVIVEDVLDSTARFFANPCALRTNGQVVELARSLAKGVRDKHFAPIAGGTC